MATDLSLFRAGQAVGLYMHLLESDADGTASARSSGRSRSPVRTSSGSVGLLPSRAINIKGGAATLLDVYQAENVLGATEATVPQLTIQLQQGLDAPCQRVFLFL
jgi:hypothetical protein